MFSFFLCVCVCVSHQSNTVGQVFRLPIDRIRVLGFDTIYNYMSLGSSDSKRKIFRNDIQLFMTHSVHALLLLLSGLRITAILSLY